MYYALFSDRSTCVKLVLGVMLLNKSCIPIFTDCQMPDKLLIFPYVWDSTTPKKYTCIGQLWHCITNQTCRFTLHIQGQGLLADEKSDS